MIKRSSISVNRLFFYLLMLPTILILSITILYPIYFVIRSSFFDLNLFHGTQRWVGFHYYLRLLNDTMFLSSLWKSILFVIGTVTGELMIGFLLALILNRSFRGRNFFRIIVMTPLFVMPVAVGIVWRMLYNPDFGPISFLLAQLGVITQGESLLSNSSLALPIIILASIWQIMPFSFLILLAGLQGVPKGLIEAAKIDGASFLQELRYITLPWLKPMFLVILLLRSMDAFKVFGKVFSLTGGGPGSATEVSNLYIHRQAFQYFNIGYASSLSVFISMIVLFICISLIRLFKIEQYL